MILETITVELGAETIAVLILCGMCIVAFYFGMKALME